jgi:hypothetical protein
MGPEQIRQIRANLAGDGSAHVTEMNNLVTRSRFCKCRFCVPAFGEAGPPTFGEAAPPRCGALGRSRATARVLTIPAIVSILLVCRP